MSNLPNRRQLQRELSHAWLVSRTALRRHSKAVWLAAAFVGLAVIVIFGVRVPSTASDTSVAVAPVAPAAPMAPGAPQSTTPVGPTSTPAVPAVPSTPVSPIPAPPQPAQRAPGVPAPAQSVSGVYVVIRGDTLAAVALRRGVPIEKLAADNRLSSVHRIVVGQRLVVSPAPSGVVVIKPGRTLESYGVETGLGKAGLMALNPQVSDPDRITAGGGLRVRK